MTPPLIHRPAHDTPGRQEWHRRLNAAYLAEPGFMATAEYTIWRREVDVTKGRGSFLYVVADGFEALKFGIGTNPEARLAQLQVGNPRPLLMLAAMPATAALERLIHSLLDPDRIRGEWFAPTDRVLALTSMVVSAAEQCDDIVASGEVADLDCTFAALTYRLEEAVA